MVTNNQTVQLAQVETAGRGIMAGILSELRATRREEILAVFKQLAVVAAVGVACHVLYGPLMEVLVGH